jgi:host factor-I protein
VGDFYITRLLLVAVEIIPPESYRKVAEFNAAGPFRFATSLRQVTILDRPSVRVGPRPLGLNCFLRLAEGSMENKPAQNIQDSFLNTARKDKSVITIYLLSGVKLTGRIRSFDKYSVVLETNNQEQLIFKHAISTVVMSRVMHPERHVESRPVVAASAPLAEGNAALASEE